MNHWIHTGFPIFMVNDVNHVDLNSQLLSRFLRQAGLNVTIPWLAVAAAFPRQTVALSVQGFINHSHNKV
jgi:hypothetical protein